MFSYGIFVGIFCGFGLNCGGTIVYFSVNLGKLFKFGWLESGSKGNRGCTCTCVFGGMNWGIWAIFVWIGMFGA